eukprot:CAMPEP_0175812742 /NCGR_PEP_ID=MMETSP0107_2-20121207/4539_1 /TAXON_ID=195067 ORGANISM="Goniomonas pacifica, Strain CCMP1869" /NCGR_SAMPLE_ID=MMETSP0107_2 /ASSEMBLY_ACC=CAM_ASM_000203 /LENGTH=136 /DNA_ID=CAMNT_0017124625 /DNA_START=294 /DNA_END=704 /DNA_ORIENTATION=+
MCKWDPATEACTADEKVIWNAYSSFPSGHSATAFAAFGVVSLYAFESVKQYSETRSRWLSPLFLNLVAALPLFFAGFVAVSRTVDYKHNYSDVITGSVLGYAIAHGLYTMHETRRIHWGPDSKTSLEQNLVDEEQL